MFKVKRIDWITGNEIAVERVCDGCEKTQSAYVNRQDWPEPLWALADVEWVDKTLYDFLS
jgi:hypothetical protein